jgi:hypothetical protein
MHSVEKTIAPITVEFNRLGQGVLCRVQEKTFSPRRKPFTAENAEKSISPRRTRRRAFHHGEHGEEHFTTENTEYTEKTEKTFSG